LSRDNDVCEVIVFKRCTYVSDSARVRIFKRLWNIKNGRLLD
jgi:hypothetical protein